MLRSFFSAKEKGNGLLEYSAILFLVAVVAIVVLVLLGPRVSAVFGSIYNSLQ